MDGELEQRNERLINPQGAWEVSGRATEYTGITNEMCQGGEPADIVLDDFLADILTCDLAVGHNIVYDAGHILEEMGRLGKETDQFAKRIREGACTFQPPVAAWYREQMGEHAVTKDYLWPKNLGNLYRHFCRPAGAEDLAPKSHSAGADAEMAGRLFFELRSRGAPLIA